MRKVAAYLFGYLGPKRKEMANLTWDDVDYRKSDRPTDSERAATDKATRRGNAGAAEDYVQPIPSRP
jgi:hypothetical protein